MRGIKQVYIADSGSFWCRGHINRFDLKEKEKGIWYLFWWIKLGWVTNLGEHRRGKSLIIWCFRWDFDIFFSEKGITGVLVGNYLVIPQ